MELVGCKDHFFHQQSELEQILGHPDVGLVVENVLLVRVLQNLESNLIHE